MATQKKKAPLFDYPWQGKFGSLEEIHDYLNHDKLTCLLCGKEYAMLTSHLKRGHRIDPDEYKEQYGITYTTRLAGQVFKAKARKLFLKKVKEGKLSMKPSRELIERILAIKKRPVNEATRNSGRNRILGRLGRTSKWGPPDFEEYLRRIQSGRTITEVSKDQDMPNNVMFYAYLKENKKFQKRFSQIWESLPFAVQARGQKIGKRFDKEITQLRREGLSWPEIGQILKCNPGTAQVRWVKLGRAGKLRKSEFQSQRIWQKTDYEEFLKRVCSGRTPGEVSEDEDMPSMPCFHKYTAKNQNYKQRFEKMWENLPFDVQVRAQGLGERYKRTIIKLRLKGLTWPQIGEITGVNHGTAQTTWSKLKANNLLEHYKA